MTAKKSGPKGKVFQITLLILLLLFAGAGYKAYTIFLKNNTSISDKKNRYIYIRSNATFQDVLNELKERNVIVNLNSFKWLAEYKKYPQNIKPGKYLIKRGMSNNQIVNILKAGLQEKVKITTYQIRTIEQLASRISHHLEADSSRLVYLLNSGETEEKFGIPIKASISIIPAGEFEFLWSTSADQFLERMAEEYKKFWTAERKQKAQKIGLTQTEVAILASIVQQEQTTHPEERPIIAGVYLNRLKQGMKLQADPTVIFALNDFSINRVLNKHVLTDSPYNTYRYEGLPPGPICIPTANAIDAVLNRENHDYIFFCAKEDLSGFHNFTKEYSVHNANAKKYQAALDKLGIK